ncbi:MAG: hypothetical protein HW388_953 [Dehalococcoidia bacterium]|nr:hypothetical protein [Dehalococcoidia bacterium]
MLPQAAWIAVEFYSAFGVKLGVTLTPVGNGRLEVYLNGETLFKRTAENRKLPDLDMVKAMKNTVKEKLEALEAVAVQ